MKNHFSAKFLLLPFLMLFTFSVAVKAQVKKGNDVSHIRTVGGDNRFYGHTSCPEDPLDQVDELNLTLFVNGPADPSFVWPSSCNQFPRISVFYNSLGGDILLGYSEPITDFQVIGNEATEACQPGLLVGNGPVCTKKYYARVSIPVDFSSICEGLTPCELTYLEYRLVGSDLRKLDRPYASQVSNECMDSLFPSGCFCHPDDYEESGFIMQPVWLNCSIANARTSSQEEFAASSLSTVAFQTAQVKKTSSIQIYPNPVHDQLIIQYQNLEEKNATIQLVDSHGKRVVNPSSMVQTGPSTWQIHTQNLLPGIYFCQIQNGKELLTKKIVKLSK